jgi:cytochrome c-type biogenesis protein CcmH/NrfG
MTDKNRNAPESISCANRQSTQDWLMQLQQLSDALVLCPTDIATRSELAALLEQLEQHEEALVNWNAILVSDPNNLMAREGSARCRQRMGRPLQSPN